MARRGRRRTESGLDLLIGLPWQISVFLGLAVFVGLKWILPAFWISTPYLKSIASGLSGVAWIFAAFFLVAAAFAFASQKRAAANAQAAGVKPMPNSPRVVSQQPSSTPRAPSKRCTLGEPLAEPGQRIEPTLQAIEKPTVWSLELIRAVEWKRFEDLCQQFYEAKGIRSETTPLGPDGGIDIRLYQDGTGKATSVVQCKAWGARFVGVQPVRELLGVMTHERIAKGFFMTSGRFSDEAKVVAKSNGMTLIDGQMLLMMLLRMPTGPQQTLLAFATAGDYMTPTCPSCGLKMRSVAGSAGRPDFWGCPSYPKCRGKLGMRGAA